MIHETILKWDGQFDCFMDRLQNDYDDLISDIAEFENEEKEFDITLKENNFLMNYDLYRQLKTKCQKLQQQIDNPTQNIANLQSFNDLLNKKLLSKIPITTESKVFSGNNNTLKKAIGYNFPRGYRFAYIHAQPEHRLSQYAFLGIQNYHHYDKDEYYTDRLLDKFLNVIGLSYLNISNRSSYFNLNVTNTVSVKSLSPAALSMNNISGYLKRIRFNHNYALQNYRDEKQKLSFEIKAIFNDETDTILFEVLDIQGQWILEDIILNAEVLSFKGRKVLFQLFISDDENNKLASDSYFYF